jgi:hypothetical protein
MLRPYANIYVIDLDKLAYAERYCRLKEENGEGKATLGTEHAKWINHELQIVVEHARYVLPSLSSVANEAAIAQHYINAESRYADVAELVAGVRKEIYRAISVLRLLPVEASVARYYEEPYAGWESVIEALPETRFDIQEAGRAVAVGLPTACVFHLTRVTEIGVRAIGRRLRVRLGRGKTISTADWQGIFEAIDKKLDALRNPPQGKQKQGKSPRRKRNRQEQLQWYAETRAQLTAVRDAWRNHVSHAKARYNEHEARGVYDHVRPLMQRIAEGPPK